MDILEKIRQSGLKYYTYKDDIHLIHNEGAWELIEDYPGIDNVTVFNDGTGVFWYDIPGENQDYNKSNK